MSVTDYQSIGAFPLQDHHPEIPLSTRQLIAGARIRRFENPNDGDDPNNMLLEVAAEDDKGTVGDVHPWMFIQCADREKRGMGSWAQVFAALSSGGGTGGSQGRYQRALAPTEVHPIRDKDSRHDPRYKRRVPGWPTCFPTIPQGVQMLLLPGTEESRQEDLMLHADPRLFAVNVEGPGEAGSLVCDLQPEAEPCMDGSRSPGHGGRHARLQSMLRVIPLAGSRPIPHLDAKAGNAIAWNLSTAGVDEVPGYGMVWGRTMLSGPSTGHPPTVPPGPVTPGSDAGRAMSAAPPPNGAPQEGAAGGAAGGSGNGPAGAGDDEEGKRPGDFGEFKRKNVQGHGLALMAHLPAFGPFHIGDTADQHYIGRDKDGHPINSGHIATGAYYFRNAREDGPLFFEQDYTPPAFTSTLRSPVHLEWDREPYHPKVGGSGRGIWRWTAEVPYLSPPTTRRPVDPVPPPRTPGGPGTPTGPRGPGGPTTGGGPGAPGGPTTGGGVPTPPPGGGTGAPRRPDMPVYEIGPRNPGGPFNPGGSPEGFGGPSGPSTPGSEPTPPPVTSDPEIDAWLEKRRKKDRDRPRRPASISMLVGDTSTMHRSSYSIFHPMHSAFAEMAWRPQHWSRGAERFSSDPHKPCADIEDDEEIRPQVLGLSSWGAQSGIEWNYASAPGDSRARGGTASGGILFRPPQWEMEDYLQINSAEDVTDSGTTSYVTAAPNVAFALGVPTTDGDLDNKSYRIRQNPSATDRGLLIEQKYGGAWVEVFAARVVSSSGEVVAELAQGGNQAVRLPRGDDADRPSLANLAGMLRINSETPGFDYLEYWDEQSSDWIQLGGASVPTSGLGLDEVMAASVFGGAF